MEKLFWRVSHTQTIYRNVDKDYLPQMIHLTMAEGLTLDQLSAGG